MEKNYKKNYKKIYKKMNLLKYLKISLLNCSFIVIYTINKILVLIKNHLNYLNDNNSKCFFKEYNIFLIFLKN